MAKEVPVAPGASKLSLYTIAPTRKRPPLAGEAAETPWESAATLKIAQYPWFESGEKQATTVRLLYDRKALYVQFQCSDRHIFSRTTELNGPVCQDSCVEFFATPEPGRRPHYFNLEINCCGVFHLGFGPGRHGRRLVAKSLAGRLPVATSEPGGTREESPEDRAWWVAAALPFDLLSAFARTPIAPAAGSTWLANFYRCGGRTDDQYACWNRVEAPQPDFHRPECFGALRFGG